MKRTSIVVAITLITMVAEIFYGLFTGSMALLTDGIHMGTHTFALVITLIVYYIAQKHTDNPNFAFSSGKVGLLGGYSNAIILAITAIYMVYKAVHRLINPETIIFNQALIVAVFGLSVNIISAVLLSSGSHNHDHHHDHNLRSAYIHVITDAMTSVFAIMALLTGKFFNQYWPDAVVAILGAIVILKWAYELLLSSGKLLVDYYPATEDKEKIQFIATDHNSTIQDLHLWHSSENDKNIILNIKAGKNFDRNSFIEEIKKNCHCSHITLELEYS